MAQNINSRLKGFVALLSLIMVFFGGVMATGEGDNITRYGGFVLSMVFVFVLAVMAMEEG